MRYTLRDDTLPHQIRLFMVGWRIAVGCNCLANLPLRVKSVLTAEEALEVYRRHLAELERGAP